MTTGGESTAPILDFEGSVEFAFEARVEEGCFIKRWHAAVLCEICADGSFKCDYTGAQKMAFQRDRVSAAAHNCFFPRAQCVRIPKEDLVGASQHGKDQDKVVISFCTETKKGERRIRKLRHTRAFKCSSTGLAEQVVQQLRKRIAWWGRRNPPHLTVFVNPISGSGRSKSVWKREVLPILEAAGHELKIFETQGQGHAFSSVQDLEPDRTDAIVVVGGDGTMSEVVQALLTHKQKERMKEIPLMLIPGGTGNGMSASLGLWTPTTAAHALCRGKLKRIDILSIDQPLTAEEPAVTLYSFLSITFGLIANVDIGTENLRCLGSLRNEIGALKEIFKSAEYTAEVAVLPAATCTYPPTPHPAFEPQAGSSSELTSSSTPPSFWDRTSDLIHQTFGPMRAATDLCSLPMQNGWRRLERSAFSVFVISVMPHLALDFTIAPSQSVDSGTMTLTHMPGKLRKLAALRAMLKIESGKMDEVPGLVEEDIVAFVLEPRSPGTWLVMDGEVLPSQRLFGQIHPGLCRCFCAPDMEP